MKIYLLAGLGADERLFSRLDLSGFDVTTIRWHRPSETESMEDYARHLLSQVDDGGVLIGQSFGGMMAIEMGKIMQAKKIVLISSSAVANELPLMYRIAGKLKIHRLFSAAMLKSSHRLFNWVMGATDPIRKKLLTDMLRDTDEKFLHWAIDKVVTWKNETIPANVVRIHGTKDHVLPLRKAEYIVRGGGHLIVANRAPEVTGYLKEILVA